MKFGGKKKSANTIRTDSVAKRERFVIFARLINLLVRYLITLYELLSRYEVCTLKFDLIPLTTVRSKSSKLYVKISPLKNTVCGSRCNSFRRTCEWVAEVLLPLLSIKKKNHERRYFCIPKYARKRPNVPKYSLSRWVPLKRGF